MSRKAANSNKRSAETAFDMDDEFPFSSSQQLSLATTVSGPIKNATPTNYLVVSSLQVSHSNFEQDHEMDQSPATHKGSETSGPGSSSSSNEDMSSRPQKRRKISASSHLEEANVISEKLKPSRDTRESSVTIAISSPSEEEQTPASNALSRNPVSYEGPILPPISPTSTKLNFPEESSLQSPIPACYTDEAWARLSRYPAFTKHALSAYSQGIREGKARFVKSGYSLDANVGVHRFARHVPSPLSSEVPTISPDIDASSPSPLCTSALPGHLQDASASTELHALSQSYGFISFPAKIEVTQWDRRVKFRQGIPKYGKTRKFTPLKYFPMTKGSWSKSPGPPKGNYLLRMTLLINFGNWMHRKDLYSLSTTSIVGMRNAERWWDNQYRRQNDLKLEMASDSEDEYRRVVTEMDSSW